MNCLISSILGWPKKRITLSMEIATRNLLQCLNKITVVLANLVSLLSGWLNNVSSRREIETRNPTSGEKLKIYLVAWQVGIGQFLQLLDLCHKACRLHFKYRVYKINVTQGALGLCTQQKCVLSLRSFSDSAL